jgi:AbrB family transcriptional regulator (stage V sporulation protein T)
MIFVLARKTVPNECRGREPRGNPRSNEGNGGDPLEIYTDRDGEVIFKKYSPIGELGSFAAQYAETLAKTSGHPTCITDKDNIIAASGLPKKEVVEKKISNELEKVMEDKSTFTLRPGESRRVPVVDGMDKYVAGVICPIISEGDSIGSVVFMSGESASNMGVVEEKLAQAASGFLGKQMEQ